MHNLPLPNPYDVLEISPAASHQEITIAFTKAMKRGKYSPREIAQARKSLMNPQERIIADYLRPITGTIGSFKRSDFTALDTPIPKLKFLTEFDALAEAIGDRDRVSDSDKRLGKLLFSDRSHKK
ncbi:molecular chaperone DnaJ [Waterburya agarophytonicola K14]|uniref:Molecular chaperone DnaJ n=1 Tax=Waterburya agarophytonicola KI4 TaxID=2874699 RepID=A0A964BQQ0_9CYAN|nr:hypothetical protein [Waterburya agarophytonicola]MCC0177081.1 molecular chaperone DnaJ [Waterburya agarophytonicola KI4]